MYKFEKKIYNKRMMKEYTLEQLLKEILSDQLLQLVLSGNRNGEGPSKVKIRPVLLKNRLYFQASETHGAKEIHKNYEKEEMTDYIREKMNDFRQLQALGQDIDASVLVSKKGKETIKVKKHPVKMKTQVKAHNRMRNYILEEGIPVPFLVDLGVQTPEGKIIAKRYDKFRQINRFLEFVEDILPKLPSDREVTILDFGCGKSYLTFAMYHYLRVMKSYDVNIIGLDLKMDVIQHCNELAEKFQYDKLHFYHGDIAEYEGVQKVDMVVTLHACDTATDYALAKAVRWGAEVILSVPCCQHEVNRQIENDMLFPFLEYGILKERASALITDGIRAQLLKEQGYDTQILEFIDMEHTPKNLLIRAVRTGRKMKNEQLRKMCEELHVNPTLLRIFREEEKTS